MSMHTPRELFARVVANHGMSLPSAVKKLTTMGFRGKEMIVFFDSLVSELNLLPKEPDEAEDQRRKNLIALASAQIIILMG